jgi:CBS domain-containing protein
MTRKPESVKATTPLNDVLKLLLPSVFSGLPVLDEQQRPVGVVTQGDLIRKGGLPLRLGLLAEADQSRRDAVLNQLESRQAGEVMTTPAVIIADNRPLADAVDMMLSKGVKRLVVVDEKKRLSGMLSRLDIFRTVMREAPEWKTFSAQEIEVGNLKLVGEVLRRDTHKVSPHASLDEVIRLIDSSDIQRVAVVDPEGKLLGLIADRDLLRYFKSGQEGIWHHLAKVKHPFEKDSYQGNLQQSLNETTAGMIMKTELVTVHDDMMIEEAISLMVDRGLKRLPVIDADGRFRGMISRDELLRTGLGLIDK